MTEWATRATDVDQATRLSGLLALTHFDISSGTPRAIAMLRALAVNEHASQDERGAAIGLCDWLSGSEITAEEIPLLFALLEKHQDQLDEWRPLCNFAVYALKYDYEHRARIIARATELRKHLWDRYFIDEILKAQSDTAAAH